MKATSFLRRALIGALFALALAAVFAGCGGHNSNPVRPRDDNDGGGGTNSTLDLLPTGSNDAYGQFSITNDPATSDAWDWKQDGANLKVAVYIDLQGSNLTDKSGSISHVYLHGVRGYPGDTIEGVYYPSSKYGEFTINPASVTATGNDSLELWPEITANGTAPSWVYPSIATDDLGHGQIYHFRFVNGLPVVVHGRAQSGGGTTGYVDVLSGSTDSTVTKDHPFKLSNPEPNHWHLRQYTDGAKIWGGIDGDWSHYVVTIGGPLFPTDPLGYWQTPNTIVADFPTPPDGQYAIWYPLWNSWAVGGNNEPVGAAWAIGGRTWGSKYGQLVQWQGGQVSWFYPSNAPNEIAPTFERVLRLYTS